MKILIEESVLRQALETFTHCYAETDRRINERAKLLVELRSALDAAEKVEPVAWIVPEFGFLFPTKNAATSYLRNIESSDTPTPLYTHSAPAVPEKVEPVALDYWHQKDCEYLEKRTNTDSELREAAKAVVDYFAYPPSGIIDRLRKAL